MSAIVASASSPARKPPARKKVVVIGDFGKDLDDEHTLLLAASLMKRGLIELVAVIGNLHPADLRARIAKGTLDQIGLLGVPVAIGKQVTDKVTVADYEKDIPYIARAKDVEPSGEDLLFRTLSATKEPIILVLQSGLTDAAEFIEKHPELAKEKIKDVVIMGGVEFINGKLKPNDANNNKFDMASAEKFYELITDLDIPSTTVTREAAYATKIPFELYDRLERTGHPVGKCLFKRQMPALQKLWEAACSDPGAEIRGTLPNNRDRGWFVKTFCSGIDPGIENGADITPYLDSFNLYDPINLIAAVPSLSEQHFNPIEISVGNTKHYIIGVSEANHGVKNPQALRDFLLELETEAPRSSR